MYQIDTIQDTITAIATPVGMGGIGIVRLSGPQAISIVDSLMRLKSGRSVSQMKGFTAAFGFVVDEGGAVVDEALVTLMRAPKSYTAQDVAEISVHGGHVNVARVLELAIAKGARLASPGEFTKRAYLNGRIDLAQAEAVLDIIQAKTAEYARISQNQLQGALSKELEAIREELMAVYTHVEVVLNFPEDDLNADDRARLQDRVAAALSRIDVLLASGAKGRILKEGVRVVLCGRPNAGKSSLLNALVGEERAIVTEIAGTTRDIVEGTVSIEGVPVMFIDTAGIVEPKDRIEQEAQKRSRLSIESADLCLLVVDTSLALQEEDKALIGRLQGRKVIVVLNKCDLPQMLNEHSVPSAASVRVSALHGRGIDELKKTILNSINQGISLQAGALVVSNARHLEALNKARALAQEAAALMTEGASLEVVSQDIKDAVNALDAITGRQIDADLIDRIFSSFCIGK